MCQNLEIGNWKVKNVKSTASKEDCTKEEYNGEALSKNINPIIFAIAV